VVWAAEPGTQSEEQPRKDVALVELPEVAEEAEPVTFGRFAEQTGSSPIPFEIYGWPCWARTQREGRVLAGGRLIPGLIYPADTSPEGLLVVEPERGPDPGERCDDNPGSSAWEGVSGAAVVCAGAFVVAVQRHHQNPRRQRSLEAVLLGPFLNDAGFRRVFQERGQEVLIASVARLATPLSSYVNAAAGRFQADFAERIDHLASLTYSEARDRFMPALVRVRPRDMTENPTVGSLGDLAPKPGHLAFLSGPGGSGKSTSLLELAISSARAAQTDHNLPVPFYARLASFDARERGFPELLEVIANAAGLAVEEVDAFWRQTERPGMFLLDGLNEVNAEFSDACLTALRELTAQPGHAYLISSRPGLSLDELERATKARVFDLVALDRERIGDFLRARGATGLLDQLTPDLWILAQNPFMLWALVRTMEEGNHGPRLHGRGELYRQLIEDHLFSAGEQAAAVDYNYSLVKKPVMSRMAYDMSIAGATRVEESDEFLTQVAAELNRQAAVHRNRTRLRPRILMPDPPVAGELVDEAVSNGLLTRSGSQLEFWHQSVQEYYTAEQLKEMKVTAGDLLTTMAAGEGRDEKESLLSESIVVLAGLLPSADQLITGLSEQHPLLAARCLKEAHEVSPAIVADLRERWLAMVAGHHEERRRQGVRYIGAAGFTADKALAKQLTNLLIEEDDLELENELVKALAAARSPEPLDDLLTFLLTRDPEDPEDWWRAQNVTFHIITLATADDVEAIARRWLAASGTEREDLADVLGLFEDRKWGKPALPAVRRLRREAEERGDDDTARRLESALAHVPEWSKRAQQRWPQIVSPSDLDRIHGRVRAAIDGMSQRSEREVIGALADKAFKVRQAAADELARRKPTTSIGPLVTTIWREDTWTALRSLLEAMDAINAADASRMLEDDVADEQSATRLRSAVALHWLGTNDLDDRVCEALNQESAAFRTAAAVSLGRSHAANAVSCLASALLEEKDAEVLVALLEVLRHHGSSEAVDLLLSLMLDPERLREWPSPPSRDRDDRESLSWQGRIHRTLVSTRRRQHVVGRLTQALDDGAAVRAAAIWELSAWPPLEEAVLLRIRQAFAEDPDPAVRAAAAYSTIRLATRPGEIDQMIDRLLRAELAPVRRAAIEALGTRKSAEAIDGLVRLAAAEQDDDVVRWIGGVLGGQERSSVDSTLMQSIESGDESQAYRSATLLGAVIGRREDAREQQLKPLVEAAGRRGSRVLLAALDGYGWRPLPKFVLSRLLSIAWRDPLPGVRNQAADILRNSSAEDALYQPILTAFTEGRYDDVISLIGPVGEDPFLPDAEMLYIWRAQALMLVGQDADAQRDIEKVISLGYDFVRLRLMAAHIHDRNGDLAGALSEAQQAVIINPDSADAHNGLGWYKLKLGHSGAAAQEFSRALHLDPSVAGFYFNLGLALLATDQRWEATAAYQNGLERLNAETSDTLLDEAITDLEELQPGESSDREEILRLLRTRLSVAKAADNQRDRPAP
jgi:tetratricopeptide (TPR) repeat protein